MTIIRGNTEVQSIFLSHPFPTSSASQQRNHCGTTQCFLIIPVFPSRKFYIPLKKVSARTCNHTRSEDNLLQILGNRRSDVRQPGERICWDLTCRFEIGFNYISERVAFLQLLCLVLSRICMVTIIFCILFPNVSIASLRTLPPESCVVFEAVRQTWCDAVIYGQVFFSATIVAL